MKTFKRSPVKNSILQTYCKQKFGKELQLLLDCKTRWNSIEVMLARFIKIIDCVEAALKDLNLSHLLNENTKMKCQNILEILQPVKIAVEALGMRDTNLIKADGILSFLYNELKIKSDNAEKIGTFESLAIKIARAVIRKIDERRNMELVTLMKFLQNPKILDFKSPTLEHSKKSAIIKFARNEIARLFSNEVTVTDMNDSDDSDDCVDENTIDNETDLLNQKLKKAISDSMITMNSNSKGHK